jgi:predicted Zn-dependent protease
MGEAPELGDRPSASSTHPAPVERTAALAGIADARTAGESNQKGYFAAIDGMSVDDPSTEGFVRGTSFFHPTLRLTFTAPPGFRLFNDSDGVLGISRDRSILFFACATQPVAGRLDDWMRDKLKPTPTDIQSTEINGAEAAIGAKPRGADTGLSQARYILVRHGASVCNFALVSEGPDRDRQIDVMVNAARSFRTLSPSETAALRPYRLRVVSPAGSSPAQLAARTPYPDFRMERLLVMNAAQTPAELSRRREIKTVEP